ncbi:MAG: hypothetical protein ABI035_13275 [Gemmatimonadaceae bacterium]
MAEAREVRGEKDSSIVLRAARHAQRDTAWDCTDEHGSKQHRDLRLLVGIRENDAGALRAFVKRFRPLLLDQARRLHVAESERVTTVTSFLDDMLISLARLAPPNALSSYVVTSFRNCIAATHRHESMLERQAEAMTEELGAERAIGGSCSEFMLRSIGAPDDGKAAQPIPGVALVRALLSNCTVEEKQLLVWISHRVPLRDCAGWLGISYESAKQRVSRLRARLKRESAVFISNSPVDERDALVRILARGGVTIDDNNTEEPEA